MQCYVSDEVFALQVHCGGVNQTISNNIHLAIVHGPGDGSEIPKGDFDRRFAVQGPVCGGARAVLQQKGAHISDKISIQNEG